MSPIPVNPASLVARSRRDVAKRLLERLPALTDFTYVGEGSIIRGFIEAISYELGNVYSLLNYSFTQQLVTEATGASLDALGVLYNVYRRSVLVTTTQNAFYFYLASSPNHQTGIPTVSATEQFTIPAGTIVRISDDFIGDNYSMSTVGAVTFGIGDQIRYVGIKPVASIMRTNIAPHTLRVHDYEGTGSSILYCTNPIELDAATGLEPDEEFRARIVDAVRGIASSNRIAVRLAALSINHVRDAKVIERPYGPATMKVVIATDGGAVGTEVSSARAAVELVRAAGTLAEVTSATQNTVDITYGFTVEDLANDQHVQRAIETSIRSYIGSLGIGQAMRKTSLAQRMYEVAPTAIDVYIIDIKVNGLTFIGDVYKIPEDSIFVLGTLAR